MRTIIVDVRSSKEFQEGTYPGAVNIPSNEFSISRFNPFKGDSISLVCYSGRRAKDIKFLLEEAGFRHVSLMQYQIAHFEEHSNRKPSNWTIDRQFRLALSVLIGIFLVGNYLFDYPHSLAILLIVFAGLIYSAITDNCYLKVLIANLPWNKTDIEISKSLNPATSSLADSIPLD